MRIPMGALLVAVLALAAGSAGAREVGCAAPEDGARFEQTAHGGSLVTLEWGAASERTRIQLATDDGFEKPLLDRVVHCCEMKLYGLEPGAYHWRVLGGTRAADPELCRASFDVVAHPKGE